MSLPNVIFKIQDGGLGLLPASSANSSIKVGVCSGGVVGQVYSFSDLGTLSATLGQGPLVEAVAVALASNPGGGPVLALPINPSSAGSASAVTHTGTGAGTVVPTAAPAVTVALKIILGGVGGTFTYALSVNGGAYGPTFTSSAGTFTKAVPGTLTTLSITDHTYTAADVFTVSTLGVVTVVGSGTASWITQVSSPLDAYNVLVTISTAGALGAAQFTYSVDGGNTTSGAVLVPSGGVYAIPNTGIVLTFASTFVLGDTYTFTTSTAGFSGSDVTASCGVAIGSPIAWSMLHLVGAASAAAGAATIAAILDVQAAIAFNAYLFVRMIGECPIVEVDATIATAFASFASTQGRTCMCVGDVAQVSPISGRVYRRNIAWAATARAAGVIPSESIAFVGRGALTGVVGIYPNFGSSSWDPTTLDLARFITPRQFNGTPGFFVTRDYSMAVSGSDFSRLNRGRVMDLACVITRAAELPYLNGSFRVDPTTGFIDPGDADAFEAKVNAALKAALVQGQPGTQNASAASCSVARNVSILNTNNLPVTVAIVPLFIAETITTTMGFSNPAAG